MSDYPLDIVAAHGRIDAYRAALEHARDALLVTLWDRPDAFEDDVKRALAHIEAELSVTA